MKKSEFNKELQMEIGKRLKPYGDELERRFPGVKVNFVIDINFKDPNRVMKFDDDDKKTIISAG